MKKAAGIFIAILSIMLSMTAVFADTAEFASVNPQTNVINIKGNVKETSSEIQHDLIEDSGFDNGIDGWVQYGSGTLTADLEQVTEEDGNKCLKAGNRTGYDTGFQFNIAPVLNVYGLGTYRISFKLRADDNADYTAAQVISVLMIDKKTLKITNYHSSVTKDWNEYTIDLAIDSFGYDDRGNPYQECKEGTPMKSGTDGSIVFKTYKKNNIADTRNIYIDDFQVTYIEKISAADGDAALDCTVNAYNGETLIYSRDFKCDSDGEYDFCGIIPKQESYDDIKVNITCPDTKVDETISAHKKNKASDFALSYTDTGLEIGVNPYNYIKSENTANTAFIAAVYNEEGILTGIDMLEAELNNKNALQKMHISSPLDTDGKVSLYVLDKNSMKPLEHKSIKSCLKEKTTVYLIGDSICQKYDSSYWPKQGWGELIGNYFDDSVTFVNCSGGGLSTKSYIAPTATNNWKRNEEYGTWEKIKDHLQPGDFVIMGLGVNDAGDSDPSDPDTKATTEDAYAKNIKTFAKGAREKGAQVIFTTMTIHGGAKNLVTFNGDNTKKYIRRGRVMQAAADEAGADCVNLGGFQLDYYNKMTELLGGTKESYNTVREYFHLPNGWGYPTQLSGGQDYLHYSINGANKIAGFIASLIKDSESDLAKYVNDFEIEYKLEDIQENYKPSAE
mgnify:CR=1 FL=1